MAITKDFHRQYPLRAYVPFTYADFGESGVAEEAVDLPAGAIVTGGEIVITTAFNSAGGTTPADTLTVGDGSDDARYAAGVDGQTAARTALGPTGYKYPAGDTVDIKWTPNADTTTAPTQGAGYLVVEYVKPGRSNEVQD